MFKCKNERCNTEIVIKDTVTEFVSIFVFFILEIISKLSQNIKNLYKIIQQNYIELYFFSVKLA